MPDLDEKDTSSLSAAAPTLEPARATGEFRWPAERPGEPAPRVPGPGRPIGWRRRIRLLVAAIGITLGIALLLAPTPAGLNPAGKASFAVFVISTTLWITSLIPLGITGLLAIALLALLGALKPADAYAAFGNSAVFFILCVFILAAAIIHTGLSKRLALFFLQQFQRGPFTLAGGIMVTAAFLTIWMPNQATAAMLFPITIELAHSMRLRAGVSQYGKVIFLALAWGAKIGSNASYLGSARAPLALALLERTFGHTITFTQWVVAACPVVILGLGAGLVVLRFTSRLEPLDMVSARRAIADEVMALGAFGSRQLRVAMIMLLTIIAWIFLAKYLDRTAVALLAAVAMFATGILKWSDLEGYIQWGIVLMYGGAIAIGEAIDRSGAAKWLVAHLTSDLHVSPFAALAGLAILSAALAEVMSNAAAVAVILPLAFSVSAHFGISPVAIVLTSCIGAGVAFTLPISSSPNTIVYSSGYVRMRDMMFAGSIMTLILLAIVLLTAKLFWPLIGIS
jgi:solute carrier family 13 (sodium-dependent dicarboxylate transporter), member 2/3/5